MLNLENDLITALEPIIKQAGDVVLEYYNTALVRYEKNDDSFATEADLASERFLIKELGALMPEASFFAEESGVSGRHNADYCWVIDPIDGTTNFAKGIPHFCISVALTYKNKPILGAIYQPLLKEFFYAVLGQGAYLNGTRIRVQNSDLTQGVVAIVLPYAKDQRYAALLQDAWTVSQRVFAIRHLGSAALDLAYVAAGRFDGVITQELKWWDVAAGMVLVTEAGGSINDFQGKELTPVFQNCVAAGGAALKEELMKIVKTHA